MKIFNEILIVSALLLPWPSCFADTKPRTIEESGTGAGADASTACSQALIAAQSKAQQHAEKFIYSTTIALTTSTNQAEVQKLIQEKNRTIESSIKSVDIKSRNLSVNNEGIVTCKAVYAFYVDPSPIANFIQKKQEEAKIRLDNLRVRDAINQKLHNNAEKYRNMIKSASRIAGNKGNTAVQASCIRPDFAACDDLIDNVIASRIKNKIAEYTGIEVKYIDIAIKRDFGEMVYTSTNNAIQKANWKGAYTTNVYIKDPFENENRLLIEQVQITEHALAGN